MHFHYLIDLFLSYSYPMRSFGSKGLYTWNLPRQWFSSFDPAGLGLEWDGVESIRDRLRSGKSLVVPGTSKSNDGTIPECVTNQDVLVPVLTRLLTSNLKLPSVPGLRPEVEIAYGKNNRTPDEATVDDDAWELRKLLRFVKRKSEPFRS